MKIAAIAAGLGLIAAVGVTSAAEARDRHVEFSVNFGVPIYHYVPPRPVVHHHIEYYPAAGHYEEYYEEAGHYHNGHYCRARHAHGGHHGHRGHHAQREHDRKFYRTRERRDD